MTDVIIVGVPLLAILAGLFFNNSSNNSRFDRIENRLDRMQADLQQFYMILGEHKKAIEVLEKQGYLQSRDFEDEAREEPRRRIRVASGKVC